jgi:hypothetical protein
LGGQKHVFREFQRGLGLTSSRQQNFSVARGCLGGDHAGSVRADLGHNRQIRFIEQPAAARALGMSGLAPVTIERE